MYTVKVLSEAEFEKLPFKRIQERPKDILGAADPRTNTAYIRDTGYNDITKHTIEHELDELMAKVSPHEEDGIRYKDFSQSLGNFGSKIPVIGKLAGPALSAVGHVPDLIGAGARKIGLPSFNVGMPSPGKPTNAGAPGGVFSRALNIMKGGGEGTTPSLSGGFNDIFSNIRGFTPPKKSFPQWGMPNIAESEAVAPKQGIMDMFKSSDLTKSLKDVAGPVLVGALGNMFAPKVSPPDFSKVSNRLRSAVTEGTNPELNQNALAKLNTQINTDPFAGPPPAAFTQGNKLIDEQFDNDLELLKQQFKAANPSMNIENNSAFQDAQLELIQKKNADKQALADAIQFEFLKSQQVQQLEAIKTALNLDNAQISRLIEIAQLDIAEIMAETGINYGEAAELKELFGGFGEMMLQKNLEVA